MKKCLIIVNFNSGGSRKISFDKVEKCLGDEYAYTRFAIPYDGEPDVDGYDAVAVCGGDGTLANALQKTMRRDIRTYYFPTGTLNDRAKAARYSHARSGCPSSGADEPKHIVVGTVKNLTEGERAFSYVLAAGSFTPIGYTASVAVKKRLGIAAYLLEVVKQYRAHRIRATIEADGMKVDGEFTLIMFLKSPRCFGFTFNRAFDPEETSGHLIAIRSPKHRGLAGLVEMFFPFFRVFFIGLKKERDGNIIFKKMSEAKMTLYGETTFCRDGEKQVLPPSEYDVGFERSVCGFNVIEKF